MNEEATSTPPELVPGKDCGSCSMCCKIFKIAEVDSPPGEWCRHVVQGKGCGIHATRPQVCRGFFCHWLRNPGLDEEWKPEKSKFVLYTELEGRRMVVAVDQSNPTAWKREPYYSQFKQWALMAADTNRQLVVFNNENATLILPHTDMDLGIVNLGDEIIVDRKGMHLHVTVRRHGGAA